MKATSFGSPEAYFAARDEALINLDLDFLRQFCPGNPSRKVLEITAHKMRYESLFLPVDSRLESAAWLRERGYQRFYGVRLLPPGQLP